MRRGEPSDEVGILERRGAEHHAGHPRSEQRLGGLDAADTSAGLHRHVQRSGDRCDQVAVAWLAGARRVEVDDVHPRRTLGLEGERLGDGFLAVDGAAAVVALVEPHATPLEQVDRRIQIHQSLSSPAARRTKFASSCNPGVPDFSGWNCVAMTISRWAAAVIVAP